jgi:hypothetical protein
LRKKEIQPCVLLTFLGKKDRFYKKNEKLGLMLDYIVRKSIKIGVEIQLGKLQHDF